MNTYTAHAAATPVAAYRRNFAGTSNPRHLRAIKKLLDGPVTREELDKVAGVSNSPHLVAELRALGLEVPCERQRVIDRDGKVCQRGVYRLTDDDWFEIMMWKLDSKQEGS